MVENESEDSRSSDSDAFNRRFKHAVIAYAIIEFIVIAFVVYYKFTR